MDRFRARFADLLLQFASKEAATRKTSLRQWLAGARCLQEQLRTALEPCMSLPSEFADIVFSSQNGCTIEKKATIKVYDRSHAIRELELPLRRWAFPELMFSFGSSQKGMEDGQKAY